MTIVWQSVVRIKDFLTPSPGYSVSNCASDSKSKSLANKSNADCKFNGI